MPQNSLKTHDLHTKFNFEEIVDKQVFGVCISKLFRISITLMFFLFLWLPTILMVCINSQKNLSCKINLSEIKHTTYSRNNMSQKCEGNCGLWVLNEIIKKIYPENLKKIMGAVWELPAK